MLALSALAAQLILSPAVVISENTPPIAQYLTIVPFGGKKKSPRVSVAVSSVDLLV